MGNSNKQAQLMREHEAEMAMIRNKHDENEKKLLIEKLALEHNLEKHKAEIARLARLDALQYQAEIKKIEAKIRENDQYHEREKITNDQIIMKKMEMEEKEREDKRNKETMLLYAQLQRENAMIFSNINKAMNGKDQENNSSNNNGNNMQFPFVFPMFGMNNMVPNNMNNSSFGFPFMNKNMMNNYQKSEIY